MSFRVEPPEPSDAWPPPELSSLGTSAPPRDIAVVMLECIMRSRGAQQDTARANIEHAHRLLEQARQEMQAALERAARAEQDGNFWGDLADVFGGDIASIAGVVAAVALAVASGGAGTPAVIALVAAGLTTGAKLGQELGVDPRLTAALSVAGGAVGLFAGNVSGAGNAWTTVAQAGGAVQGGATAVGGTATVVEGHYRADAIDARADAQESQNQQNAAWLRMDLAIGELERACRDIERARERASNIEKTESDGAQSVIARIGAA
jgi:hypothetical protein